MMQMEKLQKMYLAEQRKMKKAELHKPYYEFRRNHSYFGQAGDALVSHPAMNAFKHSTTIQGEGFHGL